MSGQPATRRILLKLSGEALAGNGEHSIDPDVCAWIARDIAELCSIGVQLGIVIGGGNVLRGASLSDIGIDRTLADSAGMLATLLNSLILQGYLNAAGVPAVTMSAVSVERVAKPFIATEARELISQAKPVIIACGTGNPFFTTDTAAALRCAEIQADVLVKATKVDGIYDSDPMRNPGARRFERLSYTDALSKNLRVMDATAFSFCMEQSIPIVVLKLAPGNIRRFINGEPVGTTVTQGA